MSDKPPIPLAYHEPDRRPKWAVHRGSVFVLLGFVVLFAVGWLIDRYRRDRTAQEPPPSLHDIVLPKDAVGPSADR